MRHNPSLRLVAAIALLLSACGGGDPFANLETESDFGAPVTGAGEEAAATVSINDAQALQGMTADAEVGEASIAFFSSAANTPIALVSSAFVSQRQLDLAADIFKQTMERAARGQVLVPAAGFPDCVESSATSVRFNDCQVMTDTTTTTMNGVVEVVDGRIFADIQVEATFSDGEGTSLSMSMSVTADLAVTDTSVDGRIDVHASVNVPGAGSATQDSTAIYDIELQDGCAVGGELRVGVQQKASAGGRTQKLRAIGRAVFGPACGDVTVYVRQD